MPDLVKWMRKRLSSGRGQGRRRGSEFADPLPLLPEIRPRPLTPSPESTSVRPGSYGLFDRLPFELRHTILLLAFGGGTLHVDLHYGRPLERRVVTEKKPTPKSLDSDGGSKEYRHYGIGTTLVPDRKRKDLLEWEWVCCWCHRARFTQNIYGGAYMRPSHDGCLKGQFCYCNRTGSEKAVDVGDGPLAPSECALGIMGWLLSCRQAYAEGINVLIKENSFHFSSMDMLYCLPQLMLPSRLEGITSVELLLTTALPTGKKTPAQDWLELVWRSPATTAATTTTATMTAPATPFDHLFQTLPQTLPHLKQLHIAFMADLQPPGSTELASSIEIQYQKLLRPIEDMVASYGPGRDISVALPFSVWNTFWNKCGQEGIFVPLQWRRDPIGLWQPWPEDGDDDEAFSLPNAGLQVRFWKPLGPPTEQQQQEPSLGYWVCDGYTDFLMAVMPCFGTTF